MTLRSSRDRDTHKIKTWNSFFSLQKKCSNWWLKLEMFVVDECSFFVHSFWFAWFEVFEHWFKLTRHCRKTSHYWFHIWSRKIDSSCTICRRYFLAYSKLRNSNNKMLMMTNKFSWSRFIRVDKMIILTIKRLIHDYLLHSKCKDSLHFHESHYSHELHNTLRWQRRKSTKVDTNLVTSWCINMSFKDFIKKIERRSKVSLVYE